MASTSEIPERFVPSVSREAAERLQQRDAPQAAPGANPSLACDDKQQQADRARTELAKRRRTEGE